VAPAAPVVENTLKLKPSPGKSTIWPVVTAVFLAM
jgi:hypothetical protein